MKNNPETIGKEVKNAFNLLKNIQNPNAEPIDQIDLAKPQKKYHVHFGAGKLGLGLVLPKCLSKNVIVVQHPSPDWNKLKNLNRVKLVLNNKPYHELPLLHSDSNQFIESFNNLFSNSVSMLLVTNNFTVLNHILNSAVSISTALGIVGLSEVVPLLDRLKSSKKVVNIYPFENDVSPLELLKNYKLKIVPLIADKICKTRKFSFDSILIDAEEFEEVYLLANKNKVRKEIQCDTFCITENKQEFDFYRKRKLYIVNGLHLIAALLGYEFYRSRGVPLKEWGSRYLSEILGNYKMVEQLELYTKIQALRLIFETDRRILEGIYQSSSIIYIYDQILSYGINIIKNRFNFSLDHLDRLLDLDMRNLNKLSKKLDERINKIRIFIQSHKSEIKALILEIESFKITFEELLDSIINLQQSVSSLLEALVLYQTNAKSE